MKWLMTVTVLSLMAENAYSGLQGGNTQIFRPVNEKGERIEVSLGVSHPEQAELKKRIENSGLPDRLRWEMATDLEKTLVYTTNEILKYKDVIDQVVWIPQSKTVEKTTGSKKEKETTTYEAVMNCNYSICVEKVNLLLDRKRDFYVSAIYDRNRNEVIYFQKVLDKMTQEERMEVVLHEQGHRLGLLGKQRENERFVTGWSRMMTDYLLGKSNQEDLDQFLKNVGLFEVYHDKGLPGEVQIGLDSFYVPREIEVDASFFENISVNDDRSVYINYPVDSLDFPTFKKGEFKKIIFKTRSYQHYNSGFKYLNLLKETIRSYFKKHPKKKIDLRIFYTKKKTRLPNGLEKNTITFLEINYELDPYEDILLQISSVFKEEAEVVVLGVISRFYRIFNLDLNQMIVFGFDPEKRALLSSYLTRFKEALDRLKQRDYFLYSAVLSATLAFDDPHFGRTSLIDIGDDETLHMNSEDLDRYLNELASEKDKEFHERIMKYQIKDLARYNRYDDDYYLTGDFLYTESFLMELFEKIHQKEKSLTVSEISEKYRSELINPMIGIFNCIDSYFLKAKLLFLSEQNPNLIELKMVKYDSGNSYYSDLSIGFRPDIFEKYTMQEVVQMIPMLLSHKKAFKKYGYLVLRENSSGVVVMNVTRPGYFMDEYKKVFRKDTRKIRKIIKSGGCF